MDDEATREFIIETREGLDQLDRELLALEADPQARERIATVFRTIHTIKGTSAFLGFGKLEKLAHVGESLLAMLRDGTRTLSPEIASALLALVDRLRTSVTAIEASGNEPADDHADLIARLGALRTSDVVAAPAPAVPPVAVAVSAPPPAPAPAPPRPRPSLLLFRRLLRRPPRPSPSAPRSRAARRTAATTSASTCGCSTA